MTSHDMTEPMPIPTLNSAILREPRRQPRRYRQQRPQGYNSPHVASLFERLVWRGILMFSLVGVVVWGYAAVLILRLSSR